MRTEREVNERQVEVLRWIATGCTGQSPVKQHTASAAALQRADLVEIQGAGKAWRATVTPIGHYYLLCGDYPPGYSGLAPSPKGSHDSSLDEGEAEAVLEDRRRTTALESYGRASDVLRRALEGQDLSVPPELDQRWYSTPHCDDCEDEIPEYLAEETGYRRQVGEYVRPSAECVVTGFDGKYLAGVFHSEVREGLMAESGMALCELVPEPGNWYDAEAVAVDHEGNRIGYLRSDDAPDWHELVRWINARGLQVLIPATPDSWFDPRDEVARSGVTLHLPADPRELADIVGLGAQFEALMAALKPDTLELIRTKGFTRTVVHDIRRNKVTMPTLPWDKTGPYASEDGLPGLIRGQILELLERPWWRDADAEFGVDLEVREREFAENLEVLLAERIRSDRVILELLDLKAHPRDIAHAAKCGLVELPDRIDAAVKNQGARCSGPHCSERIE